MVDVWKRRRDSDKQMGYIWGGWNENIGGNFNDYDDSIQKRGLFTCYFYLLRKYKMLFCLYRFGRITHCVHASFVLVIIITVVAVVTVPVVILLIVL